ncbi:hypothetical protein MPSEU_000703400 [Mayamaea pseudoterrestris]|nr:hypothetical protein MPSEU_000703400 [Mayamaea pseudoterrestris]
MTTMTNEIAHPETVLSLPMLPSDDPAAARMNRKHKLRSSKQAETTATNKKHKTSPEEADDCSPLASLAAIPGVKLGSRYEPDVPMTKAQLAQWRKQARRVRNRESAAASREKTRMRIEELEVALTESQAKYAAAMKRIAELEKANKKALPIVADEPPSPSIICTPDKTPAVSPPLSPREAPFSLDDYEEDRVPDHLIRPMYQQSVDSSELASDETAVVDSDDAWDDDLDDPDIGDFLYEALYNEHPAEMDVDFDALATI